MAASINGINSANAARVSAELFSKLDTKSKGYIDQADLEAAAPAGKGDSAAAAELLKQLDGDSNGQVSKSELSAAVDKVGAELDAQFDQSRLQFASADGATGQRAAGGGGGGGGGSGGNPPVGGAAATEETDSSETAIKYNASADSDSDGTVTADEDAAYKKQLARMEERAREQLKAYAREDDSGAPGQARALDISA